VDTSPYTSNGVAWNFAVYICLFAHSLFFPKVVDMRPSEAACLRIHFMGYKKTHQRWADPSGADSGRAVMPARTHTPVPPPAQPRTSKHGAMSPPPTPSKAQVLAAAAAADEQAKAAAVPTTTNRFGRAVPKAFAPKAVAAARRAENREDGDAAMGESGNGASGTGDSSGGEGKGGAAASSDDLNDWYCSVCMAFEREDAQEDDVLLSCDGPCLRSFHVNCLGLDAVPEDEVNVKTSSKAFLVRLYASVTYALDSRTALQCLPRISLRLARFAIG